MFSEHWTWSLVDCKTEVVWIPEKTCQLSSKRWRALMVFMELLINSLESAPSLVNRSRPARVLFKADAALTDSISGHHKVQYVQIPVRSIHNGLTESGALFLTYLFVFLFLRQGLLGGPGWPGYFHIYLVSASRLLRLQSSTTRPNSGVWLQRRACSVSDCVRRLQGDWWLPHVGWYYLALRVVPLWRHKFSSSARATVAVFYL